VRTPRSVSLGDGSEQLSLIEVEPSSGRRRRTRYVHVHTPEELAAFDRSKAIIAQIRGDGLSPDEKRCPGAAGSWSDESGAPPVGGGVTPSALRGLRRSDR
jgi:hypothetical protein